MKHTFIISALLFLASCGSTNEATNEKKEKRIISLSGTLTEIIYELGEGDNIVGVDVTSTYPSNTEKLNQLGHISQLNIESLVSLKPTDVFLFEDEFSPQLKKQFISSKINFHLIKRNFSIDGTKNTVTQVAKLLNKVKEAKDLIEEIENSISELKLIKPQPKVLFVYARGAGTLMVGGEGTPIEKMIELAGGINAGKGFQQYKPMTSEGVIAANPDVILMFDSGMQSLGNMSVFELPGVVQTNAGKNRKLITMDGQFLSGFGPRVGKAIKELNENLD